MDVAPRALAGAVIGSVLGTAILCLLISFLYFRHTRNQRNVREFEETKSGMDKNRHSARYSNGSAGIPMGQYAPPHKASGYSQFPNIDLARYTPEPVDDNTVSTRLLTIFDQASLHVENFYSPTASPALASTTAAKTAQFQSPYLPGPLEDLLSTPRNQRALLTHVLVRALLSATQPGSGAQTLLPPALASAPQPPASYSSQDTDQALFAWRMLTIHLYERDPSPPPLAAIARLAETFTSAFAPYGDSSIAESRRIAHLADVAKAAADTGAWLFKQPCTFSFVWSDPTANGEIDTHPAIIKVTDEHGWRLSRGQVLTEPTKGKL